MNKQLHVSFVQILDKSRTSFRGSLLHILNHGMDSCEMSDKPDQKLQPDQKQPDLYTKPVSRSADWSETCLDNEQTSLHTKLDHLKNLLMKNNIEILVRIEKFLLNTLQENTLSTFEKFRLIDNFISMPNGCMLYKTVQWIYYTGAELMWNLFNQDISVEYKVQASGMLLRQDIPTHRKLKIIQHLSTYALANSATLPIPRLANLADILHTSGYPEAEQIGRQLLDILRTREREQERLQRLNIHLVRPMPAWEMPGDFQRLDSSTIYNDGQNVHDSSINNTIKKAIDILARDYIRDEDTHKILSKNAVDVIDDIQSVLKTNEMMNPAIGTSLNRITTDYSTFSEKNRLRLREILQRVWNRIMNYMDIETQKEAIKRLVQELKDMSGLCSTGHMSRIVNVLMGFPLDKGGLSAIKISWESQIQANIQARLDKLMRDDISGDIVTSLISSVEEERKLYLDFVKNQRETIYDELLKEFTSVFDKELENMETLTKIKFTHVFDELYNRIELKD